MHTPTKNMLPDSTLHVGRFWIYSDTAKVSGPKRLMPKLRTVNESGEPDGHDANFCSVLMRLHLNRATIL